MQYQQDQHFQGSSFCGCCSQGWYRGCLGLPSGNRCLGGQSLDSSEVGQAVFYSCTFSQLCVYPNTSPYLPTQTNANSISLSSCPWACWCAVQLPQDTREPRQVAPGPWQGFVSVLLTGDKRCPTLTETENCVPKSLSPFPHRSCVFGVCSVTGWDSPILSHVFFPAFLVCPQSRGD